MLSRPRPDPEKPACLHGPPRAWPGKLGTAYRGLKMGVRGHISFFMLFFFAVLAGLLAFALGCHLLEWCLLLACLGMVFAAELFRMALKTMARSFEEGARARTQPSLEIAAGALLVVGLTAVAVGGVIFAYRLTLLMQRLLWPS